MFKETDMIWKLNSQKKKVFAINAIPQKSYPELMIQKR